MPNILTAKQDCRVNCGPTWTARIGDVHRCKHGVYFMSTDDYWGGWLRLSRFSEPIRYRRAVKALSDRGDKS